MKIGQHISIYQLYISQTSTLCIFLGRAFLSVSPPWLGLRRPQQGMDDIDMEFKQRVLEHLRIRAEEASGTDWRLYQLSG